MTRALILLHRWLGVTFCLFFAMWFATGIVMHFMPFPALTEADGSKLAKSRRSMRLAANSPLPQLLFIFSLLGLAPPPSLRSATISAAWSWAITQWNVNLVPKRLDLRVSD